ncbi:MAG: sensor histidine kinase, partial [Aggregatilineales bacterium]
FVEIDDETIEVYDGDEIIGVVNINPENEIQLTPARLEFVETVNWSLMLAAGLAGLAAVFMTVTLSRQILIPVADLTLAAKDLKAGNLNQRVDIIGSGEIADLAKAFNAMADTLRQNEEVRRNMVSDIAHELRTPLTNIRGYLEALQDGFIQPDKETVNLLHEEAMLLNRLIQDLQELALAESGQLRFVKQAVNLDEVMEQTVSMLRPGASSKAIQLNSEVPDELPPVYADEKRVAQIMRNLINNAISYTPADGAVYVSAITGETEIEVTISDTGEGIAREHLPYLFERFYRVDPSRSRITGGAGLGLAIVKQLVEGQGGNILVESEVGRGTSFIFTLPIYQPMY